MCPNPTYNITRAVGFNLEKLPEVPVLDVAIGIQGHVLSGEGVTAVVAHPDVVAGISKDVAWNV